MYDDRTTKIHDKAVALIVGIRQAIKDGVIHYRKSDNRLLKTEKEILKALVDEGEIVFEIRGVKYE